MIPKFNPAFQSDEEAIANFVVRQFQFEQIIDALLNARPPSSVAPRFLISAPRGAGKTTLCRRVVAEVRTRSDLEKLWQPVFLGEESYSVTTAGEFLLEVLFQLNDQAPEAHLQSGWELAKAAQGESELIERSLSVLRSFVSESSRRLLVVVENFHVILADQVQGLPKPGEGVLELLQDDELFSVLATSVAAANDDDHDFLPEDYSSVVLAPLSLNECRELWLALTKDDVPAERIRPIQILTGGSPRLIHILADFMKTRSLRDLMDNLNFLIDQNTEYFKSQLDALPAVERKVFAALLEIWDPASAKQVAEVARVNTNIASAMLARLTDRGSVIKEPGTGRSSIYFAAERLFNIYYLMRRRSHPSSRVKALVTFMVEFYSSEELVNTTASLAKEACDLDPSRRGDYHSTFDAILSKTSGSVRDQILRSAPSEFILSFRQETREFRRSNISAERELKTNSNERLSEVIDRIESAADQGEFFLARDLIKGAIALDETITELWMRLAFAETELGNLSGAIEAAQKASKMSPDEPWTHTVLGLALRASGSKEGAITAYRAALAISPGHEPALIAAAEIAESRGDNTLALELYQNANAAGVLGDHSRVLYAELLSRMNKTEMAEELLRQAAGDFDSVLTREALIEYLHTHNRSDEAKQWLEDFTDNEARWEAYADLGRYLLTRVQNSLAARDALRTAIEMGADEPFVFSMLAQSMIAASYSEGDVTAVILQMLAKFPDRATSWVRAGLLYEAMGDEAQAEAAYRSAIEREDGKQGRLALAFFLDGKLDRMQEVEGLLREAVDAEHGRAKCMPMRELAEHLIHRGNDEAASIVLNAAISANDHCSCCHVLRGDLCRRAGRIQAAEDQYRKALGIDHDDVGALTGLAHVVGKSEAAQLIAKALKSDSADPRAVLASLKWSDLEQADRIDSAKRLADEYPNFLDVTLFAATLEAQVADFDSSINRLAGALNELPIQKDAIPLFVKSAMAVVEAGGGHRVRELLASHRNRNTVEPLLVAISLAGGEKPLVAKEVLEVARDILSRSVHAH
ncbi:tetratricopeptide repeat protein [Roseibium aggregatum]|uniref:tetratricopeptide repeat protein n=1 Tax=Roseibium aggregatum TaxID=187304 RepID=UPI001A8E359E|nr:tetratricopeptide repeat protein [Roseibium aggregatum]MBN8183121.1 tetratricopeptide repeat protein [Roseibium aggregatum]